ncbi:MAG: hypothetical protein UY20_C0018G0001 [Candidatus Yanofskybacteria bacterium GW2011_GWA1_48_10]|uniref:Uncharacterized protein n=2 Tax=Candidatus Yanofskyibacteriota TaxID=1752733 RepID=A0A0G1U4K5_9BACT|nr:MAG: hypothetical protein UY20_C0018G0001 [Candidatus Yanofskybacteria bacterium GW2011_GWA1_48_10]OGN06712.1 MAG: hypothetical protein A2669_00040 [Candidatus Yanofskybacteria bacterium RIFCSPHIGHO2_01_FULL_48_25b]
MDFQTRGMCVLMLRSADEYEAFAMENYWHVSMWGRYLLRQMPLLACPLSVQPVVVSNRDLGFTEEWVREKGRLPQYRETQERGVKLGLKIPPIQLGPECWVTGFEQFRGENITICSQPLSDSCATIKFAAFALDLDVQTSWLLGTPARSVSERSLSSLFMFVS